MKKIIKDLKEAVFAGLEDFPFAGKALRKFADVYKNEPVDHNNVIVLKSGDVIHGHYIIHSNGTVTDTRTKLMWKRCCEGQTWDGTTCIGEAKIMTWNEIMPDGKQKSWPAFAGRNDWRVPTRDELKSLVYCSSGSRSLSPIQIYP